MKGTLNYKTRALKGTKASIQLIHRFGRKNEVRFSTGFTLNNAEHWNSEKQRVRLLNAEPQAPKVNRFLDKNNIQVTDALTVLQTTKPNYTKEDVIKVLNDVFGKSSPKRENLELLECYEWYINYFSKNPTPTTLRPMTDGTTRSFRRSLKILKGYSNSKGRLNYSDITMDFYLDFVNYLRDENYSNNYIANHIKNLKTILNYSLKRGYHNNREFQRREFAKPSEQVDTIYLSVTELKTIENLKLPLGQSISRDLFLIGAYSGLRVSDFNRLTKDNIREEDGISFITIQSQKTNRIVQIPCHPSIVKIFKKYNDSPPPRNQDQHINRDLKIIGKKAKISNEVTIEKTIGGKKSLKIYKKYELISTHTARRSFCTNAYLSGMPTIDIMTISGHQTERVFYNYIKASSQEKVKKIAQHHFFKS